MCPNFHDFFCEDKPPGQCNHFWFHCIYGIYGIPVKYILDTTHISIEGFVISDWYQSDCWSLNPVWTDTRSEENRSLLGGAAERPLYALDICREGFKMSTRHVSEMFPESKVRIISFPHSPLDDANRWCTEARIKPYTKLKSKTCDTQGSLASTLEIDISETGSAFRVNNSQQESNLLPFSTQFISGIF